MESKLSENEVRDDFFQNLSSDYGHDLSITYSEAKIIIFESTNSFESIYYNFYLSIMIHSCRNLQKTFDQEFYWVCARLEQTFRLEDYENGRLSSFPRKSDHTKFLFFFIAIRILISFEGRHQKKKWDW